MKTLQEVQLKKKTALKGNWAVTAYKDWHSQRLETYNYDYSIYMADLNYLEQLMKDDLQYALCRFILEVTKKKGDGPYPGKTLYQMIVTIQKYLVVNKLKWKLVEGDEFEELRNVLDNIMHE